jgi:16S rRNA (cytosine967-C5)-methyltransferase
VAAQVVNDVIAHGRFLDVALAERLPQLAPGAPAALVQETSYGVLRGFHRLDAIAHAYLERPLKSKDADIHALLLVGLYQLRALRTPAPVTVAETVEAAAALRKPWAKALINACLRAYLREPTRAEGALAADLQTALNHPAWLIERLQTAYPQDWRRILEANNQRPPLSLRVNTRKGSRAAYLARLAAAGIEARALECTESGVGLAQPLGVQALPGFAAGDVSVQDAAAQLAATFLDAQAGERVLDACAAPGGKSAHILERAPGLNELVAIEIDAGRARQIDDSLARLGLSARVVTADATRPESWWDGRPFDRILCDAPCSATGVIRRHPDIKLRRTPSELPRLMATQAALLNALWPLLVRGGKLLYATCSVLPDENDAQLAAFLARHADAEPLALSADFGTPRGAGRQLLPGDPCGPHDTAGMDGFFYAAVRKR